MPTFRITKKLAKALHVSSRELSEGDARTEREWFADLFYVERRKCVLWTHRTTLFSVVAPGVVAADLRKFDVLFEAQLGAHAGALGFPINLFDRFGARDPSSFAATNDRRVIGSMMEFRFMFQHAVAYNGGYDHVDLLDLGVWLNDSPMSLLGGKAPRWILRDLIASGATMA